LKSSILAVPLSASNLQKESINYKVDSITRKRANSLSYYTPVAGIEINQIANHSMITVLATF